MDIGAILDRFVEGLTSIDSLSRMPGQNSRTGQTYLAGLAAMLEKHAVLAVKDWWDRAYPRDFPDGQPMLVEVPYSSTARGEKVDMVFSSAKSDATFPEWAVEVKRLQLIGDNGKNNDYAVAKTISPYLKDRSILHDVERLRANSIGHKKAVVVYGFEYDFLTCAEALTHHPTETVRIKNIRDVCYKNDPVNGILHLDPMIEIMNNFLLAHKLVVGPVVIRPFNGVWRHPCGGDGKVFGWQVT